MVKETITVIYYLLIMNLLSCSENTNNMLYNYIWFLIILNLNSIIFNNSYNLHINNIILFFDVVLSILIVRETNIISKKNKENNKENNLYLKFLYYMCVINILIFIYNTYTTYIKLNTINTI